MPLRGLSDERFSGTGFRQGLVHLCNFGSVLASFKFCWVLDASSRISVSALPLVSSCLQSILDDWLAIEFGVVSCYLGITLHVNAGAGCDM